MTKFPFKAINREVSPANAVYAACVALEFAESFSDAHIELLKHKIIRFKADLPNILPITSVSITSDASVSGEKSLTAKTAVTGLEAFSNDDAGNTIWRIKATDKHITVLCHRYENWTAFKKQAQTFLEEFYGALQTVNRVQTIGLQVIDIFEHHPDDQELSVRTLLDESCPYLNKNIFESGQFWHLNHGWLEGRVIDKTEFACLHKLDIQHAHKSETEAGVLIDHLIELQCETTLRVDQIPGCLQELHTQNLNVFSSLLSPEAREQVGL